MNINAQMEKGLALAAGVKTLEKAKKQEQKKVNGGHRWAVINQRTRVLVPCDKDGVLTKKAVRIINKLAPDIPVNKILVL